LRGSDWILRWISNRSIGSSAALKAAISAVRFAAYRSTIFFRFTSRAIIDFLAMRAGRALRIIHNHTCWLSWEVSVAGELLYQGQLAGVAHDQYHAQTEQQQQPGLHHSQLETLRQGAPPHRFQQDENQLAAVEQR